MRNFGTGTLFATALTDAQGNALAVPVDVQFGTLQDVSIDWSFEEKLLYGAKQFPVEAGRGKGKVGIKAKYADINSTVYSALFFGSAVSAGTIDATSFATTVPASSPYTVTVSPPGSGTYSADLGVTYPDGTALTRVASTPSTGQYSLSGAVYTFAAADTGVAIVINYRYTQTTGRKQFTVGNLLMGTMPTFSLTLDGQYGGKGATYIFPKCTASKLALPLKNDDWTIQEMDISALADANDYVMTVSLND